MLQGNLTKSEGIAVIFGEFDSIVFDPDLLTIDKVRTIQEIPLVIAFSGSDILPIHRDCLHAFFKGNIINMNTRK